MSGAGSPGTKLLKERGEDTEAEHKETEQQDYKGWVNHSPPSARVGARTHC